MEVELGNQNRFVTRRELFKLVTQADQKGFDGLKLLHEALKQKYFQSYPQRQIESQKFKSVQAYTCPHCKVEFQSDQALKGHGPKRCKKRLQN
ncbi:hypothetical protein GCM10027035_47630 [Emticicia sediminis]